MRLVCPNCEAKYEVPDDAIPDTGRDVQCASCNHSWFQTRPRAAAAVATEVSPAFPEGHSSDVDGSADPDFGEAKPEVTAKAEVTAKSPVADPVAEAALPDGSHSMIEEPAKPDAADAAVVTDLDPAPATDASADASPSPEPESQTKPEHVPEPEVAPESEAQSGLEPETEPEVPAAEPPAYAIDEGVLTILREEAEREAQARRSEARPLESQPELGIDAAMASRKDPKEGPPPVEADVAAKPSARRDLLPDVEEINSTLRPSETSAEEDVAAADAPAAGEARGGFRSGFLLVLTIAMIGAAVYALAPRLSSMVPELADPLASYVSAVDGLRMQLDGLMRSATVSLNGE